MSSTSDLSTELLKLLYIFSTSLGLWTCISTGLNKRCPKEVKHSLVLFIGILLIMPINSYLGLILDQPPQLLHSIASTLNWCYGPLMLMLVNNTILKKQRFATLAPHFFPFICFSVIHYAKLEWLQFEIYNGLLLIQVSLYLGLITSTLITYRKKIAILGSQFKNSTYHWLLYLIGGMFVILIYDNTLLLLLHLGVHISYLFVATTIGAISIYISTIATLLLLQPGIFERSAAKESTDEQHNGAEAFNEKERHIELPNAVADTLKTELHKLVAEHKIHLDPEINLSRLASMMGISNHQLSELLNIHLNTSFYDYLNTWRFKEAISFMNQTANPQSITDIAFLSGFNNRNSFYRVFKDNTGLTPGEYRKQALSEQTTTTLPNSEKSL